MNLAPELFTASASKVMNEFLDTAKEVVVVVFWGISWVSF
jgi:hypothetical protein